MPIRCAIVSQDRKVYEDEADMVVLPGSDGVMGILPNHTPLLTTLQFGVITVRKNKDEQVFTVSGGFAEVLPDSVTILADAAENVDEINVMRAEDARRRAEEMLKKASVDSDPDKYMALQTALRRSNLRLDAVKRYRQGQRQR